MKRLLTGLSFAATLTCTLPPQALAVKPINFAGGYVIMNEYSYNGKMLHMYYSPSATFSFGLDTEWMEKDDNEYTSYIARTNYLLKRWNMPEAQANVYFNIGLGVAEDDNNTKFAAKSGIMADYETRRFLVSYENKAYHATDIDNHFEQSVRAGFAPYVGEYGDLHTWFMIQADHHPTNDDQFVITPLVRMYYGTALWEAGYSSNNNLFVSLNCQF
ncbi:MAG: hypothetical protein EB060_03005 [Proteobacteria bacterium]|nr:hypothetical protein [Pseudomonadota bacterium]